MESSGSRPGGLQVKLIVEKNDWVAEVYDGDKGCGVAPHTTCYNI